PIAVELIEPTVEIFGDRLVVGTVVRAAPHHFCSHGPLAVDVRRRPAPLSTGLDSSIPSTGFRSPVASFLASSSDWELRLQSRMPSPNKVRTSDREMPSASR